MLLEKNPDVSARQNRLGLSTSSCYRITKKEIRGQILVREELTENYFQRRLNFSKWFACTCENNRFLHNIVIGDKACFLVDATGNTYDFWMYSPKGDTPKFTFKRNSLWVEVPVSVELFGMVFLGLFLFKGNVNGGNFFGILSN